MYTNTFQTSTDGYLKILQQQYKCCMLRASFHTDMVTPSSLSMNMLNNLKTIQPPRRKSRI